MTVFFRICASGFILAAATGCTAVKDEMVLASTAPEKPATLAEHGVEDCERAREMLHALFAQSDEDELRINPINALFRGMNVHADRFGDYVSDSYFAEVEAQARKELAELHAIDRSLLSPTDQLAYDTFEFNQMQTLKDVDPGQLALTKVRPVNHFGGLQVFYPTIASGKGAAPFKTTADYENNLKRHEGYAAYLDNSIGQMRKGIASGVVETRLTVENMIEQMDTQLDIPVNDSPYMGPTQAFPEEFTETERAEWTERYRQVTENVIYAANRRLRNFLADEYLQHAREGVGLVYMKGGDKAYRRLIESNTTLDMSAEEIHALGLAEVERLLSGMDQVRREVNFAGDLDAFIDFVRDDPQFAPESREWLTERYYAIGREVDDKIGAYFQTLPQAPLEIRPYEPFREKFSPGGSYQRGTPDGSRPGIFYFNAYDLPTRGTTSMSALYLHEGAPGHHFQISLAQENEDLPPFMRFGGSTAFVEGWALYAERFGEPMGLYDDPYQRLGALNSEMLRAIRLVVDTGIHAKGWSREQAIQYMLDNSSMGETDATTEIERYIAIPGQALAYKIGALTIARLAKKAENELGDAYDIRKFHDQVLMTGSLPLPILEQKIDRWIAAGGR